MKRLTPIIALGLALCTLLMACAIAASPTTPPITTLTRGHRRQTLLTPAVLTDTAFLAPEILGRPTATSVTANALPATALALYYEYGLTPGAYLTQTAVQTATAATPLETLIGPLQPNTRYYYRLRYRLAAGDFLAGEEHTFMTQRAAGSTFTFAIQGDSHPERLNKQFDPELYIRTLSNAAADQPDFYLTIGDDFSVDTLPVITAEAVTALYRAQRQWLGLVGAPVFLVNGNHEQAALVNLDGTPNNVAVWAQTARNTFYPQPAPDDFYTGDAEPVESIGLLRDYYAWTWGDALFVVIDPYWHSPVPVDNPLGGGDKTRDMWGITLGEAQYQWFKQTLEQSAARYKFVFTHHVNGTGRGGIELADLYEWGGYDAKGVWQFAAKRPGWPAPLHPLMAENGVTIFFQGHDHIFAKQELDGVTYLSLPEPANPFYTYENADAYQSGDKFPKSGHVRVTVAPEGVTVAYLRAFLPQDETTTQVNGMVAYSCTVPTIPIPIFPGSVILGRPTDTSIAVNLLADVVTTAYLTYGPVGEETLTTTAAISLPAGVPTVTTLTSLLPNTEYAYQVHFQPPGTLQFADGAPRPFHTQRAPGSSFTFTLAADPHNRDPNFNGVLYTRALQNALADDPDFHIDLGDTFMTEKLRATTYLSVVQTMLDMRPYLAEVGQGAPLYLVNGNHEGELGWLLNETSDALAVWSTQARQLYYPNPLPDSFYSGSTVAEPFIGVRDGYYAWTWGDALFVVLDPFWYTTTKPRPGEGGWVWTLGKAQYDWFKQTLEQSPSRFKFVFAHHLVGGTNDNYGIARGGGEWANFYEWGGNNLDGSWGFDTQRPGWGQPIHQLMVENHVTIFFHGHDHLFVQQALDGVIYQEVPQPSFRNYDATGSAADYGYINGVIQGNSGHLRVNVSPATVTVEYVRAYLPEDENATRVNGAVSYHYRLGQALYLPMVIKVWQLTNKNISIISTNLRHYSKQDADSPGFRR